MSSIRPLSFAAARALSILGTVQDQPAIAGLLRDEHPAVQVAAAEAQGADIILANSFGGTRFKLEYFGLAGRAAEINAAYGEKSDVAFGSQIRSYVFQPYQKVIDLRTGVETSNIAAMMDGDIDGFIQGKLRGLKREKGAASDDE